MPSNYTPTPVYPATIPIPVDGDRARESVLRPPFERLADGMAHSKARLDRAPIDYGMRQVVESYLNPVARWTGGVDAELLGRAVGINEVIYCELQNPDDPRVLWSRDLVVWNTHIPTGLSGQKLLLRKYEGDYIVGVSSGAKVGVSLCTGGGVFVDGVNGFAWTSPIVLPGGNTVEFAEKYIDSPRMMLITTPDKHMYWSNDLIAWSHAGTLAIDAASDVKAICSGYTSAGVARWVLAPGLENGKVYYANATAFAWAEQTLPHCTGLLDVRYTGIPGMRFIGRGFCNVTSGFGIWVSDDAITWTLAPVGMSSETSTILVSPYGVIVTDAGNGAHYSRDGVHWGQLPGTRVDMVDSTHVLGGQHVDAGNGLQTFLMNGRVNTKPAVYSGPRLAPMVLV